MKERFGSTRLLIAVWIIGAISASVLLVATYGRTWRIDYDARITEISICSGLDLNGTPISITHPITVGTKEIYVCGYLEGIGPTIPLEFLWEYNGDVLVHKIDHYQPSYILVHLTAPPAGLKVGEHSVLVYSGRHKLVSTEFTVEKP